MTNHEMFPAPSRHDELTEAANKFHTAYPQVYELFDYYTRERLARGFVHYSAVAVFQQIRWHTDEAPTPDNEFKLNNNLISFYSRRWMKMNPAYDGFFRTRHQTSKDSLPVAPLPELTPQHFDGRTQVEKVADLVGGLVPTTDPNLADWSYLDDPKSNPDLNWK